MTGTTSLHHVRRGTGEPLLLVHGLGGSWRSWGTVLDDLAAGARQAAGEPGEGQALAEQRHEDDDEGDEHDEVALRERPPVGQDGGQRQHRGERHGTAHAGPGGQGGLGPRGLAAAQQGEVAQALVGGRCAPHRDDGGTGLVGSLSVRARACCGDAHG